MSISTINKNSLFLRPQRKSRPLPKKSTKHAEKDSIPASSVNKHSQILSNIDNNSHTRKQKQPEDKSTMITMNRITTQTGIFNMAKVSKTVSRGPLTNHQDISMMEQEDNSMILRVINQTSCQQADQANNTQYSMMDISKIATPELDNLKFGSRRQSAFGLAYSKNKSSNDEKKKSSEQFQQLEQEMESDAIPFKEIEHNLLHGINPEDYLKRSNTLALIKRDLHSTIKKNIPHEVYLQFFKKIEPIQQPDPPPVSEKRIMPLQPSNLDNLPPNPDRKLSEWTLLMGTFSSQEEEDSLSGKVDSKSNVTMMDTDVPLSNISQHSVGGYDTGSKPDYLDSPTPVTMYPHKMF